MRKLRLTGSKNKCLANLPPSVDLSRDLNLVFNIMTKFSVDPWEAERRCQQESAGKNIVVNQVQNNFRPRACENLFTHPLNLLPLPVAPSFPCCQFGYFPIYCSKVAVKHSPLMARFGISFANRVTMLKKYSPDFLPLPLLEYVNSSHRIRNRKCSIYLMAKARDRILSHDKHH